MTADHDVDPDGSDLVGGDPVRIEPLSPEDEAFAERLRAQPPRPSPRLRRRVGDRVAAAFARRALRPRAAAFVASGGALLAASVVLALSGPR
jgi:hypothetical protein